MALGDKKNTYLIGIKGVGMTALAQILKSRGIGVMGSDTDEKFFTDEVLDKLGIEVIENFSEGNISPDIDLVIRSQAYTKENNIEVFEAEKRGVDIITYPEALAELFNSSYGIAVCGTHGKSTTSAMLGFILEKAGFDPTVVVGSRINEWGSNARAGNSKYFVIEADEYKSAFLRYKPKMIILTNIDFDHPDAFKNENEYRKVFEKFMSDNNEAKLIDGRNIEIKDFNLKLPGAYNLENATLAYRAALSLGVEKSKAVEALEGFGGLARRFESYGEYRGALLYDDYAHHPTEIRAVLKGAKQKYPGKKIIALFQPHTYSRTEALFGEFIDALEGADEVYILKTYGSAREEGEDTSGKNLADKLNTKYFQTHKDAAEFIKNKLNKDVLFLALGAGDGWEVLKLLN
ncbi:MAG: cyanophycin synthetase [Candidatus Spechtbacterales bacterium]|nr:cyanophycin synthetase [Candidatus Spechtbacterales bacterium]